MTPSVVLAVSFTLCSIVGIASIQRDPAPRRIEERTLNFSVEENSVIGTEIGTVALTQPTEYTTPSLRYKLGTPSKLFAVDEVNGRLVTVALLDAELLCASAREQEVMSIATLNTATGVKPQGQQHSASTDGVTDKVTCSQNGIVYVHLDVNALLQDSSLRATHRVAVQVHDLNDNWPKFDQIRWHKRLNEVLYRKGRRLDLPKATDADLLEEHNRVHYRLELATENTGSNSINPTTPFRLEISPSGTPGLVLTEDLDAETKPRHHFVLVAYSPSLAWVPQASEMPKQMEARLHIDIEVADMNDNEPRFDSTSYNTSVAEDTPPGTVIYEMIARDPDSTARLVYSMGSTTETTVMQSTFSIETNGAVRLRSFLDYELRHTYIVPVKVSDGEFTTQAQLFVHVLDVNDEAPEFEVNPKQLIVEENASAGKLIGRVRIRDSDSNAVNGKVHCWEPVELRRRQVVAFVPDPSTAPFSPLYDLTTRMVLDREAIPEPNEGRLLVYLVCADGNEPIDGSLLATTRHTATMTVTLTVKDDNDHSPVFLQMVYHATIYENNQLDEKIIQVNATDADEGENARITYSLLDMANFKADPITGWIMANVIFDREMRNSYQVTVFAKDQGSPIRSTSVLLHVTVLDRNDHQPQLLPNEEESSVYDLSKLQTGRVGNVNLFAVLENLPMNTHIGDVLAKDEDVGSNAEMEFMQIDDKHYSARFRILRNGSVLTAAELDREEKEHYRLAVQVCDHSPNEPLTSTGTISIVVLDVNDNAPNFVRPAGLYPMNITESMKTARTMNEPRFHPQSVAEVNSSKAGNIAATISSNLSAIHPSVKMSLHEKPSHIVTTLHAKDPDAGQNGRITYELYDISSTSEDSSVRHQKGSLLRVKPDQGDVLLKRHMYPTDLGLQFFLVKASDGGYPSPKVDSKVLVVLVEDTPPIGSQTPIMHASNFYSMNQTDSGLGIWGFDGRINVFIIVALAVLSGLLASILITAIACASGVCSNNCRGGCSGRRRHGSRQRPSTSPGCSETGNGHALIDRRLNDVGNLPPYALSDTVAIGANGGYGYLAPEGANLSLLSANHWRVPNADSSACLCGTPNCHASGASLIDRTAVNRNRDHTDTIMLEDAGPMNNVGENISVNSWGVMRKTITSETNSDPQLIYENLPKRLNDTHHDHFWAATSPAVSSEAAVVRVLAETAITQDSRGDIGLIVLPRSNNFGGVTLEHELCQYKGSTINSFCVTRPIPVLGQPMWCPVVENNPTSSEAFEMDNIFSPLQSAQSSELQVPELMTHEWGTLDRVFLTTDQLRFSRAVDVSGIGPPNSSSYLTSEEPTDSGRGGSEEDEHSYDLQSKPQFRLLLLSTASPEQDHRCHNLSEKQDEHLKEQPRI